VLAGRHFCKEPLDPIFVLFEHTFMSGLLIFFQITETFNSSVWSIFSRGWWCPVLQLYDLWN
jgi:hypothetical protein